MGEGGEGKSGGKNRDPYFDNVRFFLMLLVPLGHTLAYYRDGSPLAYKLYVFIYLFHMPAFVLITGYVSRNFVWNARTSRKTVETILVPSLIFSLAMQSLNRHYFGGEGPINPFMSVWLGWFLWGILIWRFLTPLLQALRWPVLWAGAFSLALPFWDWSNFFGFNKVMSLLPFYAIGMSMKKEHFTYLSNFWVRVSSLVFLSLMGIAASLQSNDTDLSYLLYKWTYEQAPMREAFGTNPGWELPLRAGMLIIGLLMSLAFCSLVPWARSWISPMGSRTLYAYLLHGFVLVWAMNSLDLRYPAPTGYGLALMIGVPILVTLVLLTRPVQYVFRYAFEPNLKMLFHNDSSHDRKW